jgi:hypothetical protein
MKPTPIEVFQLGLPMTDSRQMPPDALTYDDCRRLLEAEYPQHIIADKYSMSIAEFRQRLGELGLKKNGKSWDYRAPGHPKDEAPEPRLTPGDLTREQAARMLLAGVSKTDICWKYNFPNPPGLNAKLEKWGLHRRGAPPQDFKTKQDEMRRMAAAVLAEIQKDAGVEYYETKTDSTALDEAFAELAEHPNEGHRGITGVVLTPLVVDGPDGEPIEIIPVSDAVHQTIDEVADLLIDGAGISAPVGILNDGHQDEEIRDCVTCGHLVADPYTHCNMPTQDIRDCIDADYLGWIPRIIPISEAVHQAVESGEVKIETVEKVVVQGFEGLEEGVRDIVEILMKNGVKTFSSCEGGRRHPYRWPTVQFHGDQKEALRARSIARENGFDPWELKQVWLEDDQASHPYCWEMSFRPPDDHYLWQERSQDQGDPANYRRDYIPMSEEKIAYLRDLENAVSPAPSIDLSTMRCFTPGNRSIRQGQSLITMSTKGTVRICAGLVMAAPEKYHSWECKFPARIYLSDDDRQIVIRPADDGYCFNSYKNSSMKKCSAIPVTSDVKNKVGLPAAYQGEWNVELGVWVGKLIESKAGVA